MIRLWDAEDGAELAQLIDHGADATGDEVIDSPRVAELRWYPRGQRLISVASWTTPLRLRDLS